MNKKKLIYSAISLVSILSITSCGRNSDGEVDPPRKEVEATHIEQTYKTMGEHSYFKYKYLPNSGKANILVLPIWFADSSNVITDDVYKANIVDDVTTAIFGDEEDIGWYSLKNFYEIESNGKLTIDGHVSDWYETSYTMDEVGHDENLVRKVVADATNDFFNKNHQFSRDQFDADDDGALDAVMCIYAAPDYYQDGYSSYSEFWAYATTTGDDSGTKSNPILNEFYWSSFDFLYGETTTYDRTGTYFYSGDTFETALDTRTLIHETGHLFGFPDYYDYAYGSTTALAGCFSMQDYAVGSHDPYSYIANGWADPYIITEPGQYVLNSFQESRQLILLTPEWNKYNSAFDEYLILELFTPTGLNEFDCNHYYTRMGIIGPKTTGIRLWHVDARLYNWSSGKLTSNATTGKLLPAFTNCTDPSYSILGPLFVDYNVLQLIKNNKNAPLRASGHLQDRDMFYAGSSFSLEDFNSQFANENKLNNDKKLGWKFTVKEINKNEDGSAQAIINIYKTN